MKLPTKQELDAVEFAIRDAPDGEHVLIDAKVLRRFIAAARQGGPMKIKMLIIEGDRGEVALVRGPDASVVVTAGGAEIARFKHSDRLHTRLVKARQVAAEIHRREMPTTLHQHEVVLELVERVMR